MFAVLRTSNLQLGSFGGFQKELDFSSTFWTLSGIKKEVETRMALRKYKKLFLSIKLI